MLERIGLSSSFQSSFVCVCYGGFLKRTRGGGRLNRHPPPSPIILLRIEFDVFVSVTLSLVVFISVRLATPIIFKCWMKNYDKQRDSLGALGTHRLIERTPGAQHETVRSLGTWGPSA